MKNVKLLATVSLKSGLNWGKKNSSFMYSINPIYVAAPFIMI